MSSSTPMSTATPPGVTATAPVKPGEIKLISHSALFYWWPVWLLAFFMAAWTWFENHRLAIVPSHGNIVKTGEGKFTAEFKNDKGDALTTKALEDAANLSKAHLAGEKLEVFKARISANAWLGSLFVVVLILTMVITNVPLRGLWSFLVIISIILIAVLITLFKGWDDIFEAVGGLHIHINMAGYLFIGTAMFMVWALATWVFDRRAYVIFTPGQIKVCEHIGAAVQTYPTMGMSMTKQRDDLFRHYILGFGSGDLILQMPSGEKREIKLPNILGISWRLKPVEDMIRTFSTTA